MPIYHIAYHGQAQAHRDENEGTDASKSWCSGTTTEMGEA